MKSLKYFWFPILTILSFLLGACSSQAPEDQEPPPPTVTVSSPDRKEYSSSDGDYTFGLTYQQLDGNRLVDGQGSILDIDPIYIEVGGEIDWLVGVPYQAGAVWTAALAGGEIKSYLISNGQVEPFEIDRGPLPEGMPVMILASDGEVYLNAPPAPEASLLTHPVSPAPGNGRVVFIARNGDLVLEEHGVEINRLEAHALPDARLIQDERGRLLFLSDPTDRYDHRVLGDALEAASITLVETSPTLKVVRRIEIPSPAVVEGIAPIWTDLNGDGEREILVTLSDLDQGARLVLFSEEGEILAQGPAAGQAYRWRNQLAAAPLGPDGEVLIIDVLRPHLDATLEFFSWEGERLVLKAELAGFSSHAIGSRNLDQALVGDLDGDGSLEVVVPGLDQESLHGIGYHAGEVEIQWSAALDGRLTSNLAGVTLGDGSLALGAGVGNVLVIWE